MKFQEILRDLDLNSLLQLLAISQDQLSEVENDNNGSEMALEYQKAIELIQQVIVEKQAGSPPQS